MLDRFESLLQTAPLSEIAAGFSSLLIRALSPREAPVLERELRATGADAAEVVALMREYAHADCSYEVAAHWDLWVYDAADDQWRRSPERLEIACLGEQYDEEAWRELGHFWIGAGFEHLFTGHAGLLGATPVEIGQRHPAESEFIERMRRPNRLEEYRQKTQENIRKLMGWVEQIDRALPVDRWRAWSEGEANFESRLESILAGK